MLATRVVLRARPPERDSTALTQFVYEGWTAECGAASKRFRGIPELRFPVRFRVARGFCRARPESRLANCGIDSWHTPPPAWSTRTVDVPVLPAVAGSAGGVRSEARV